ncbi:MAG: Chromate resistance protein ChrB [Nocardioidaceae bacterium]
MTTGHQWLLLTYRVPSQPTRARVAVWRELKRLGAHYIQQAVCVLPDRPELREALTKIRERIADSGGTSWYFELDNVEPEVEEQLIAGFVEQSSKDYEEIVEECETKFVKEIEFERYRENFTFEEAEEIRQDFDKLVRWLDRVTKRDWMQAPGRDKVVAKIEDCEQLLEAFEADVYERTSTDD